MSLFPHDRKSAKHGQGKRQMDLSFFLKKKPFLHCTALSRAADLDSFYCSRNRWRPISRSLCIYPSMIGRLVVESCHDSMSSSAWPDLQNSCKAWMQWTAAAAVTNIHALASSFKLSALRAKLVSGTCWNPNLPAIFKQARPRSLFVWSSLQTILLKKKLQTKMSEDSSDVLRTFSLKIKLQTIAHLIALKLQKKLQT
jgi:hypothetical protein